MNRRSFAWWGMALLAAAVAGYAITMLWLAPELRPPFVRALLEARPLATAGHLAGGAFALAAGALQLHSGLRNRFMRVHRWLGRVYLLAVAVGGLAALALAPHAFGGLVSHLGFGALAVFWLATTFNGYRLVRQGNYHGHRAWMIRSYALTLAAVTLRVYLPLSQVSGLPMEVAYPAIAWLCWVPNLLLAEWFIRSRHAFAALPGTLSKIRPKPLADVS